MTIFRFSLYFRSSIVYYQFNVLESDGQQLYVHLWDKDEASDDETLGR